jgi:hypothetical protein
MAIYGRMGDVVSAMFAASLATKLNGQAPDILVNSRFSSVYPVLSKIGMPIGECISTEMWNPPMDEAVAGIDMSRYSTSILEVLYPGYDRYYNCCPRWIPTGCHVAAFLAYCGGLWGDTSSNNVEFPAPSVNWIGGDMIYYHFGSRNNERRILPLIDPVPGSSSVCMGTLDDPCPDWISIDARGMMLSEYMEMMLTAKVVIGSDSLLTNLSGLLRVPTICIHNQSCSALSSDRSVYGKRCISLFGADSFKKVKDLCSITT